MGGTTFALFRFRAPATRGKRIQPSAIFAEGPRSIAKQPPEKKGVSNAGGVPALPTRYGNKKRDTTPFGKHGPLSFNASAQSHAGDR